MNKDFSDPDNKEFDISQAEQSFAVIQRQHNILHSVTPLLIASDIGVIAAAIEFQSYFLVIFGAIFPILIFFYVYRVRRMSLPAFLTAIAIEEKYGGAPKNRLASYYMAYVYDLTYYKEMSKIAATEDLDQKIELMNNILFYKNFSKRANFILLLPGIGILQILIGVFLLFFEKANMGNPPIQFLLANNLPYFDFFKVPITEPVTFLTDMFITAICIIFSSFFMLLMKNNTQLLRIVLFFFLLGLATFLGGLSHGFNYLHESASLAIAGWTLSAIGLLFFELFYIKLIPNNILRKILLILTLTKFLIVFILTLWMQIFQVTLINFGIGLLVLILPITIYEFSKIKNNGFQLMVIGISINIITLVVYLIKLEISKWINYNDLSHFILIISIILLFQGFYKYSKEKYLKHQLI